MFFTCCNSASISTENRVPAFYSVQTSSDSCVVEQSKLMDEIINLKLLACKIEEERWIYIPQIAVFFVCLPCKEPVSISFTGA